MGIWEGFEEETIFEVGLECWKGCQETDPSLKIQGPNHMLHFILGSNSVSFWLATSLSHSGIAGGVSNPHKE